MASVTQIPVSEYLQATYHPDREYIDGEVLERNVGKWSHARVQLLLASWFGTHEAAWHIMSSTEQRLQVSSTRIRVPDLVVVRPGPQPDVLVDPPLLIVEILSPDDSYSSIQERCQDYLTLGVQTVWIIDPATRTGRMCVGNQWRSADRLEVANTLLYVDLAHIFSQLETPSSL